MNKKRTYIAIDDTDEIAYFTSTGEICEELKNYLETKKILTTPITRHQLFLDPSVPYTSHNSAMCFSAELDTKELDDLKKYTLAYLQKNAAPSSAPGVAICKIDEIKNPQTLIDYGLDVKQKLLTTQEAFAMAKNQNIFLYALKKKQDGVVGALAGIALRISGNDGVMRGNIKIPKKLATYAEIMALGYFDAITLVDGSAVDTTQQIYTHPYLKSVYRDHKFVLLVKEQHGIYQPLGKEQILEHGNYNEKLAFELAHDCKDHLLDSDQDEIMSNMSRTCYNCTYRIWTQEGFSCHLTNTKENRMFYKDIDFAQMYVEHKQNTIFKGKDHNEWDKKSKELAPSMQTSSYVEEFISRMEIDPNDVVLDIGCGPGTLAVPLAKKVKQVIAIDFSKKMLEELEKYAAQEGVTNITTYHIGWEDDWSFLPHIDIAVASRSMEVSDMQSALFKMSYIAKKACYLTYKVGGSYVDMDIVDYIQKPIIQKPDYWYIPLILYTKHYLAKIDYIETKGSIKNYTQESFVTSLRWSFGSLLDQEAERAKEYYQKFISKGQKHPKPFSWAFISWKTNP